MKVYVGVQRVNDWFEVVEVDTLFGSKTLEVFPTEEQAENWLKEYSASEHVPVWRGAA